VAPHPLRFLQRVRVLTFLFHPILVLFLRRPTTMSGSVRA